MVSDKALAELAQKWRDQAAREKARRCWVTAAQARQCADELDALRARQPEAVSDASVDGGPAVEVRRILCDCHPETCCCAEAELLINGKRFASGDLDALRIVVALAANQPEGRT